MSQGARQPIPNRVPPQGQRQPNPRGPNQRAPNQQAPNQRAPMNQPPQIPRPPPESENEKQLREYFHVMDNDEAKAKEYSKTELMTILVLTEAKKEFMGKTRAPIWFKLLQERLKEFTIDELFRLWDDLDRLKMNPDRFEVYTFFPEWQKWVGLRMTPEFVPKTVEFHKNRWTPFSPELITKWGVVAEPMIPSWSLEQVLSMLMFFCNFRQRPQDQFMHPLTNRCLTEIDNMKHGQLSDFVYAMGKLWVPYENMIDAVKRIIELHQEHIIVKAMTGPDLVKVLEGLIELNIISKKYNDKSGFIEFWFQKVILNIESLENKHLAQSAWLLSRVKIPAPDSFTNKYLEIILKKINDFNAGELHMILLALKHLKIKASKTPETKELLTQLVKQLHSQMEDMWPQALSPMLLDLKALGVVVPQEVSERWMNYCEIQMYGMLIIDVLTILDTLVKLKLAIKPELLTAITDHVSQKVLGERLIKSQAEAVLNNLKTLGVQIPEDLLGKLQSVNEKKNIEKNSERVKSAKTDAKSVPE